MKSIITILLLILIIGLSLGHEGHDETSTTSEAEAEKLGVTLDDNLSIQLYWIYNSENITFEIEGDFKGWVALAYKCTTCAKDSMDFMMGHVDIVAATFDSSTGQATAYDMKEDMDYDPMQQYDTDIGGQNNIIGYGGYQGLSHTLFTYTRKLVTGDTVADYDIQITENLPIVWYIGTGNTIDFSALLTTGEATISLTDYTIVADSMDMDDDDDMASLDSPLFSWHAALMSTAFVILIPMAIFSARYLGAYKWGFYLHIILQSLALSFVIIGFVLVIVAHNGKQEKEVHNLFGVITAALTFLVGLGGIITAVARRENSPLIPNQFHKYLGRILALLSIGTMITGIDSYIDDNPSKKVAFIVVYVVIIVTYAIITVVLEVTKRIHGVTPGEEMADLKHN